MRQATSYWSTAEMGSGCNRRRLEESRDSSRSLLDVTTGSCPYPSPDGETAPIAAQKLPALRSESRSTRASFDLETAPCPLGQRHPCIPSFEARRGVRYGFVERGSWSVKPGGRRRAVADRDAIGEVEPPGKECGRPGNHQRPPVPTAHPSVRYCGLVARRSRWRRTLLAGARSGLLVHCRYPLRLGLARREPALSLQKACEADLGLRASNLRWEAFPEEAVRSGVPSTGAF